MWLTINTPEGRKCLKVLFLGFSNLLLFTSKTDPEIRSLTMIARMPSTWQNMILLKAIKN